MNVSLWLSFCQKDHAAKMRWRGIVAPRPIGRRRVRCDCTGRPYPADEMKRPTWLNAARLVNVTIRAHYSPTPKYRRPAYHANSWDGPHRGRWANATHAALRRRTALAVLAAAGGGA